MICLNYHLCLGRLYQMPNLLDNLNKTGNLKVGWLVVFFSNNKEFKKKKEGLHQAANRPTSMNKVFIGYDIMYYCLKTKFLGGFQVYLQDLVQVVMNKSRKVGQGVLYILEKSYLLEKWQFKLCFRSIDLILLATYWSVTK